MKIWRSRVRLRALTLALLLPSLFASAALAAPTFTQSLSPTSIAPGSAAKVTFGISNTSGTGVGSIAFTDSLDAGLVIATPSSAQSNCGGTLSAPAGGSAISFADGVLLAGGSCTLSFNVTAAAAGSYASTSSALSSSDGSASATSASLTVASDRPGFSKSFFPASVDFGGRSRLTFTIDNSANTLIFNPSFSDTLPTGMTIASPANAATTCTNVTLSAPAGGNVVSMAPSSGSATLAAGATCTVSVDVRAGLLGSMDNTSGTLTSLSSTTFQSLTSGLATASLVATSNPLTFTKSFTDDPLTPGESGTLSFTIVNLNRRYAAESLSFTDDLDATLSGLIATSLPSNPCGAGSAISGSSVLSLSGGYLDPEASCTFNVTVQVPASAAPGDYPSTTSSLNVTFDGAATTSAPAADILVVQSNLELTKTYLENPVGAGGSTTLEFTITNGTSSTATSIAFTDEMPVVTQSASATPGSNFCGTGSTSSFSGPSGSFNARLIVSGASLDPGASCTFSITMNVLAGAPGGTYTNTTSELTALLDGEAATSVAATDDLVVVTAPRLNEAFIDDPVAAGGSVTLQFTLALSEDATADATDITFTNDLGSTLAGLVASGLPAADLCGEGSLLSGSSTLSFSGGSLVPGSSCTFSVTLAVPAGASPGAYANSTSAVQSTVSGVATSSNAAADTLDIAGLLFTQEFTNDPVLAGGTVNLRYTLSNVNAALAASGIGFTHNLTSVLSGLVASVLPPADPCGVGSSLVANGGNNVLTFTGGSLAALTSCSFDVVLQVPASAAATSYTSTTGNVVAVFGGNSSTFGSASDVLTVDEVAPPNSTPTETTLCDVEDFGSGLGALVFDHVGDSDQGGAVVSGGRVQVTSDGSALYHATDNGGFLHRSVSGDFRAEVELKSFPVNAGGGYRRSGLSVRTGIGPSDARVFVEYLPQHPVYGQPALMFDYRGTDGVARELASTKLGLSLPIFLSIERHGDRFTVGYSSDGVNWVRPAGGVGGAVTIAMPSTLEAGIMQASYDTSVTLTSELDNFDICQPNPAALPSLPAAPACESGQVIDLIYLLDASGTSGLAFPGSGSQYDAALAAMSQMNDLLAANLRGSRVAVIAFKGGPAPFYTTGAGAELLAGLTEKFAAVEEAAAEPGVASTNPSTSSPLSHALNLARETFQLQLSPGAKPVIVLLSDGFVNVDSLGNGPRYYRTSEMQAISLINGLSYRTVGDTGWLGNWNGAVATWDGEALANAMSQGLFLKSQVPEAAIYSLGLNASATYRLDLLGFLADYTGGTYHEAVDTTDVADAVGAIYSTISCDGVAAVPAGKGAADGKR